MNRGLRRARWLQDEGWAFPRLLADFEQAGVRRGAAGKALPEEAEEDLSLWVFDLDGDKRDDAVVGWITPEGVRDRPFVGTVLFSSGAPAGSGGR
ncbi:MAG: hypothetical protein L0323_00790 [Planctomycetes bacterium]|nr:hypothetical protein [Planctomycetota bacterium]